MVIGFFMFVNVSELTINAIKYYYSYSDDKDVQDHVSFSILGVIILYMMIAIQFQFVYEMGEVYIKITSDSPDELFQSLKALKTKFIILFTLEFIAFVLNSLMILKDSE